MSIAVLCPHCQKRLNAPDTLAGRRAKCPHCSQVMQLPAVQPKPQPAPQPQAQPQEVFAELGSTDPFSSLPPSNPLGPAATSSSLPTSGSPNATAGLGVGGIFNEQQFDEMLADVGTRLDKPHEPKQDRYPCPVCHEMIVRGSKKCRYCGEDFQQQFKSLLPNKGRSSGSREFQTKMNTLGGIWVALYSAGLTIVILIFLAASSSDKPEAKDAAPFILFLALFPIFFIILGIATLRKAIWAVWVGLILTYLILISYIINFLYGLLVVSSNTPYRIGSFVGMFIGICIQIAIAKLAHRCIELKNQRR